MTNNTQLDYPTPVRYELSPEQREQVQTLADNIALSETFNMGSYTNECGTPACVAGHIVYLLGDEDDKRRVRMGYANDAAMRLMGWSSDDGNALNLACSMFTPGGHLAHYISNEGDRDFISNTAAAEALQRFAATNVFSYDPNLDPETVK